MLVGSSIGRQLAPYIKGNNIFFQGAMNLDLVKRKLLKQVSQEEFWLRQETQFFHPVIVMDINA